MCGIPNSINLQREKREYTTRMVTNVENIFFFNYRQKFNGCARNICHRSYCARSRSSAMAFSFVRRKQISIKITVMGGWLKRRWWYTHSRAMKTVEMVRKRQNLRENMNVCCVYLWMVTSRHERILWKGTPIKFTINITFLRKKSQHEKFSCFFLFALWGSGVSFLCGFSLLV